MKLNDIIVQHHGSVPVKLSQRLKNDVENPILSYKGGVEQPEALTALAEVSRRSTRYYGGDKPYRVYRIPEMADLNPELHRIIKSSELISVKGGAGRNVCLDQCDHISLKVLLKMIDILTPIAARDIAKALTQNLDSAVRPGGPYRFKIMEYWGVNYQKGQGIMPHTHWPMTLSFTYYVKTPKGCSPLLMDTGFQDDNIYDELHLKECDLVFFTSNLFHSIRPEPKGDRSIIAGNLMYYDNGPEEGDPDYKTMADYANMNQQNM